MCNCGLIPLATWICQHSLAAHWGQQAQQPRQLHRAGSVIAVTLVRLLKFGVIRRNPPAAAVLIAEPRVNTM